MDSQRGQNSDGGTKSYGRGRGRGRGISLVCYHCSASGHSQNNCPVCDKVKVFMSVEEKKEWDEFIVEKAKRKRDLERQDLIRDLVDVMDKQDKRRDKLHGRSRGRSSEKNRKSGKNNGVDEADSGSDTDVLVIKKKASSRSKSVGKKSDNDDNDEILTPPKRKDRNVEGRREFMEKFRNGSMIKALEVIGSGSENQLKT